MPSCLEINKETDNVYVKSFISPAPFYFNKNNFIMDEFDNIAVEVDADCISQDFDDYDLFGERMIGDDEENDNDGILYE